MKKTKILGLALALTLTTTSGISSLASNPAKSGITTVSAATYQVTTSTTGLNLRSGAGLGYEIKTTIPKDELVDATGVSKYNKNDGYLWYEVKYNGYRGYVAARYLSVYFPVCTFVQEAKKQGHLK